MRCHICNTDSDSVTFSAKERSFTPCSECQTSIFECLASYEDVEDDDDMLEVEDVGC